METNIVSHSASIRPKLTQQEAREGRRKGVEGEKEEMEREGEAKKVPVQKTRTKKHPGLLV